MTRTPNLLLENLVVLSLPLSFIFDWKELAILVWKKRKTTLLNEYFFLYITYTAKNKKAKYDQKIERACELTR